MAQLNYLIKSIARSAKTITKSRGYEVVDFRDGWYAVGKTRVYCSEKPYCRPDMIYLYFSISKKGYYMHPAKFSRLLHRRRITWLYK